MRRRVPIVACLMLLSGSIDLCVGQEIGIEGRDRVVLQTPGSRGRTTLRGTIIDYSGKRLRMRLTSKRTILSYPSEQIIEIVTPRTQAHSDGIKQFEVNRVSEATTSLLAALRAESRPWVRRDILAMLIRCHLNQNDRLSAGTRFLEITLGDPETRHFHLIPLAWAPEEVSGGLKSQAQIWLAGRRPVERLLGASILFNTPDLRETAIVELEALATGETFEIQELASAQLWRRDLLLGRQLSTLGEKIHREMRRLPESSRGGPYYLLGQVHLRNRDFDRAAAAFLWLPTVLTHDHHLAARACLEAADSLAEAGRKDGANTLYREVIDSYANTPFAQEAAAAIARR